MCDSFFLLKPYFYNIFYHDMILKKSRLLLTRFLFFFDLRLYNSEINFLQL